MTLDEIRDELARMDGWTFKVRPHSWSSAEDQAWSDANFPFTVTVTRPGIEYWEHVDGRKQQAHPYPTFLPSAAAALPEGWKWAKTPDTWHATCGPQTSRNRDNCASVPDTGNEIYDRYRLGLEARRAMEVKA